MFKLIRDLQKVLHYNLLLAWRTKEFWLRALVCWLVGAVLLATDSNDDFDIRLNARGPRPATSKIVLVDLNERDWNSLQGDTSNVLRPLKEIVTVSDAYFWNPSVWHKLLSSLITAGAGAIGVTPFFGENVDLESVSDEFRTIFEDARITWGADIDSNGRLLVPLFASTYNTNVGLRALRADDDGIIRRFQTSRVQVPNIGVRAAALVKNDLSTWIEEPSETSSTINYVGDRSSFTTLTLREVLDGSFAPEIIRGSVVLIGNLDGTGEQFQTPMGPMSRAEIIANITENLLAGRTITHLPRPVYLTLLALLMIGSIWVLTTYPQSVTLVIFTLAAMSWAAMSLWFFDEWFIWIPIFSPLVQLTVTCIVFLSYQLTLNERRTWRLEQEQRYLSEIEQLKSNFVSMMSHDLKTPIAKIQAICDRLLATHPVPELTDDLRSLRRSSDELHRYIQSILKVSKVEAKDFRIQKEVTDINENIEKVVARLRPLAAEKGISIETHLEPMFSIEVDTTLIQEVIHNLIENAIKYSANYATLDAAETTSKTPSTARGRVVITSQEKDDKVWVVIEDTGPGIDPDDQKTIWRKFTRGRQQVSVGGSEVKGTGLGLYLVKYFIELHGGTVFLESSLGKGTKIGFSIPIQPE